ncbi:hypothetical protein ABZP36_019058 [Zizania latifolia]
MAPSSAAGAVRAGATCVVVVAVLLLVLPAAEDVVVVVGPRPVAAQAPEPEEAAAATIDQADGGGGNNGTRARGGGNGNGSGGVTGRKLASGIDCQICEAACRVKCLINNLFQWGGCYQRCKTDNCNDWCSPPTRPRAASICAERDWFPWLNEEFAAALPQLGPLFVVRVLRAAVAGEPLLCVRLYVWASRFGSHFARDSSVWRELGDALWRQGPVVLSARLAPSPTALPTSTTSRRLTSVATVSFFK